MTILDNRRRKYSIAIPASIVSDTPHLREKTAKLGMISRACSIFGVNEILLYADAVRDQHAEFALCELILRFIETPQYLRKRLFGINSMLRFAGILPPLQISSHNVTSSIEDTEDGDLREGVVTDRRGGTILVDVGLGKSILCTAEAAIGARLSVRMKKRGADLKGEIVEKSKIDIYWGYEVKARKLRLGALLQKERYRLKIGTSQYGSKLINCWPGISNSIGNVESVLIAFGSPKQGLREILSKEGRMQTEVFDYFLNTIGGQNVSTVRTEEAIMITLGVLNMTRHRK